MPDLDTFYAGGATGAMTRAAQLQAQAASNAARAAAALRRPAPAPPPPAPLPARPAPIVMHNDPGFADRREAPRVNLGLSGSADLRENRPEFMRPPAPHELIDGWLANGPPTPTNPALTPSTVSADKRENRPEFTLPPAPPILDPLEEERKQHQADYRENAPQLTGFTTQSGRNIANLTIQHMVDDVSSDPIVNSGRLQAIQDMADAFRDKSKYKYFTPDEVADNPLIRAINDLSVWSRYRKMVADWQTKKAKTGEAKPEEAGDGTFTGLVDQGSFAAEKSPASLPPYVVARDEHGLLTVIRASQWFQGKYTDMKKDPRYAALVITALAQTSMYGTDATAKAQASRVSLDKDGNPVKAITGVEDLNALASLANQAVIWQQNGDETSIDDVLAELTKTGQEVIAQNKANGDFGGGGGGRGGGRGGGGGGRAAVSYTDPEHLNAAVDNVGRQQMGRALTPEEQALFVQYFHQMEGASFAAYQAGQPYTQLDPQGQALAWVQNHFKHDNEANQYGELAARFFSLMQGSNPFGGLSG